MPIESRTSRLAPLSSWALTASRLPLEAASRSEREGVLSFVPMLAVILFG